VHESDQKRSVTRAVLSTSTTVVHVTYGLQAVLKFASYCSIWTIRLCDAVYDWDEETSEKQNNCTISCEKNYSNVNRKDRWCNVVQTEIKSNGSKSKAFQHMICSLQ